MAESHNRPAETVLTFEQRRGRARDARYANLKNGQPDLYEKAIRYASSIQCRHSLDVDVAADIEDHMVCIVLETLDKL